MGLRSKLLLPILFGFLGFAIVIHYYWSASLLDDKHRAILAHEKSLLRTLEPGIERALLAGDLAALYSTLSHTQSMQQGRWKAVTLLDNSGNQLYPLKPVDTTQHENDNTLRHALSQNGDYIGEIVLTIDPSSELLNEKQHILNFELFTLLLFAILGVVSAIWQNQVIRKPVLRLKQAATRLANGDYSIQLPQDGNDEIAGLTHVFNTMGNNLQLSQRHLQKMVQTARANEVRTSTVLNNIVDGIFTIDEFGSIESFTSAATEIFGYPEEEIKGRSISCLIPPQYQGNDDNDLLNPFRDGEVKAISKRIETEGVRKNGERFPLELSITEMQLGNQRLFSGIARDITERKRIEQMKDEFVSTVSHELRTPLTSIKGSLGLLNGGVVGKIPAEAKNILKLATSNTDRLLLLIDDILDMQKIESGHLKYTPEVIDLASFLEESKAVNTPYAEQFGVALNIIEFPVETLIEADPDRLMQVMNNLISNAIKFSSPGSTVELRAARQNAKIRISITDSGSGIPSSFQSRIFEKFTQADSSNTRKPGSTGLGLSISKAIIEKHNGKIDFVTEEGVGTCFWFELPVINNRTENAPTGTARQTAD